MMARQSQPRHGRLLSSPSPCACAGSGQSARKRGARAPVGAQVPGDRGRGASPASGPVTADPGASLPEGLVPVTALRPGGSCWPAEGPVRAPGASATTVVRASQLWGPRSGASLGALSDLWGPAPLGARPGGGEQAASGPPGAAAGPGMRKLLGGPTPARILLWAGCHPAPRREPARTGPLRGRAPARPRAGVPAPLVPQHPRPAKPGDRWPCRPRGSAG